MVVSATSGTHVATEFALIENQEHLVEATPASLSMRKCQTGN